MDKTQSDAELFAAGRRATHKNACPSLIVATNPNGDRNYHQCDVGKVAHKTHSCGCGEAWWNEGSGVGLRSDGPLSDVVFP